MVDTHKAKQLFTHFTLSSHLSVKMKLAEMSISHSSPQRTLSFYDKLIMRDVLLICVVAHLCVNLFKHSKHLH